MPKDSDQTQHSDLLHLPGLAAPARRALAAAGYTTLEPLTELTEVDVMQLHGMGPKALEILRRALAARGLAFAAADDPALRSSGRSETA